MATLEEQVSKARAAGYDDAAITQHLAAVPEYRSKVSAALAAGYSPGDIIGHLSGGVAPPSAGDEAGRIPGQSAKAPAADHLPTPNAPTAWGERLRGAIEAVPALVSGAVMAPASMIAGRNLGYEPRTEAGQYYTQKVANALGQIGPLPELMGFGMMAPATTRQAGQAVGNELAMAREAAQPVTNALSQAAGTVTSIPGKLVSPRLQQAVGAGLTGEQTFVPNMRGQASPTQFLETAKQGLVNMQDARAQAYQNAKTGWAADKTKLDFAPIDEAFTKLDASLKENGHSKIGTAEQAKVEEVRKVLDEWRADSTVHDAVGLDALKRRISAIYPDSPAQAQAQRIITGTADAIGKTIVKQAPGYADAMKAYSEETEALRDITQALSLGDKTAKDTAIRKLQALMKDTSAAGKYRREMLDQLQSAGGVNLAPALAGQASSNLLPGGLAARLGGGGVGTAAVLAHNPTLLAALPFLSPRLTGEAAYGAGQMARGAGKAATQARLAMSGVGDFRMTPEQAAMLPYLNRDTPPQQQQNSLAQ